jgi:hypothetical protein
MPNTAANSVDATFSDIFPHPLSSTSKIHTQGVHNSVSCAMSRRRRIGVNLNRGFRAAVIFQPQLQPQPQPQIARRLAIGGEAKLPLTI